MVNWVWVCRLWEQKWMAVSMCVSHAPQYNHLATICFESSYHRQVMLIGADWLRLTVTCWQFVCVYQHQSVYKWPPFVDSGLRWTTIVWRQVAFNQAPSAFAFRLKAVEGVASSTSEQPGCDCNYLQSVAESRRIVTGWLLSLYYFSVNEQKVGENWR